MASIWKRLSRAQLAVLFALIAGWFVFALLTPDGSSIDVFLFRDAGANLAAGRGFTSASFEKSTSFEPVLYSSYTPLVQWCFAPFAALVHPLWRAGSLYNWVLDTLATLSVLGLVLAWTERAFTRWGLVLLFGVLLPAAWIAPQRDRPEELSLILLLLLVRLLGGLHDSSGKLGRWALCGLLASLCFLSEPYAGVLAVLLIGGGCVVTLQAPVQVAMGRLLAVGAVSGAAFLLPVLLTAFSYQQADHTALARFRAQANYAGTHRPVEYSMSADQTPADLARIHDTYKQKLALALHSYKQTIPSLLALLGLLVLDLGVLLLTVRARSGLVARGIGFVTFAVAIALPWAVFPLQANYGPLTAAVALGALAAGWAGLKSSQPRLLVSLFVFEAVLGLPYVLMQTVSRAELKASALYAVQQAQQTQAWLRAHQQADAVLLAPPSTFYAWKGVHPNLYNTKYYARVEGTAAVAGVLTCKNATRDFSLDPVPPALPGDWQLLSPGGSPVLVTLFGHRLMRNNWTLGCDVYVRRQP